jgi:hypothetical protein
LSAETNPRPIAIGCFRSLRMLDRVVSPSTLLTPPLYSSAQVTIFLR